MLKCPDPAVIVRPILSNREYKQFYEFPYYHYRDCQHYSVPLRIIEKSLISPRANPFFEHSQIQAFLALDPKGKVLGRIAAIKNGMHLQTHNDATGFFGFFESVNDSQVAEALLNSARNWLSQQGLTRMRGPASPSMNDISGLLVSGFESEPYFFMPYNYAYYESLLRQYGFRKVMSSAAYFIHRKFLKLERTLPAIEAVYRYHPDMKVRPFNPKQLKQEVASIVSIHNDAFRDNWGHVPFTEAEFAQLAKLFKYLIDPDLVLFLEIAGAAVGFTVCLPNYNEATKYLPNGSLLPFGWLTLLLRTKFGGIHNVRSVLTGVSSSYRGHGFDAVLCFEGAKRALQKQYQGCELSWVLDSNRVVINALESIGAVKDKEYAMYEIEWTA